MVLLVDVLGVLTSGILDAVQFSPLKEEQTVINTVEYMG